MSVPATLSSTMDLKKIRKTEDGKVSVVDVIVQVKNCSAKYAAEAYNVPELFVFVLSFSLFGRSSAFPFSEPA